MSVLPKIAFWLLCLVAVLPGLLGVAVFGSYALVDWTALREAYAHYEQVAASQADMRAVFVAEATQNVHRVNLLAEGVWTLLSAILATVGLGGLVRVRSGT